MMSFRLSCWLLFTFVFVGLSGCRGGKAPDTAATDKMRQTCAATVIKRISSATEETVFVEDSGLTDTEFRVMQWRMSTTTVSGRCLFNEAGEFIEFIQQ
ncbi:MAG: hypothetical protein AAFU71_07610, partial [Cyanobacteria bacterium J06632_22]